MTFSGNLINQKCHCNMFKLFGDYQEHTDDTDDVDCLVKDTFLSWKNFDLLRCHDHEDHDHSNLDHDYKDEKNTFWLGAFGGSLIAMVFCFGPFIAVLIAIIRCCRPRVVPDLPIGDDNENSVDVAEYWTTLSYPSQTGEGEKPMEKAGEESDYTEITDPFPTFHQPLGQRLSFPVRKPDDDRVYASIHDLQGLDYLRASNSEVGEAHMETANSLKDLSNKIYLPKLVYKGSLEYKPKS